MATTISYNNRVIHTVTGDETLTLPTNNKIMTGDLVFATDGDHLMSIEYDGTEIINADSAGEHTMTCGQTIMQDDVTGKFIEVLGGIQTVTGNDSLALSNSAARPLLGMTQTGVVSQDATPTPNAPVNIVCNNGALRLSPNLLLGAVYTDGTPEVLSVAAASDPRLPKGYTPLEYVENAGTGYIDTGIIMNTADLDVEVDFQPTGDTSGQPKMAWGYMGASQNLPRWGIGTYQDAWLGSPNATVPRGTADNDRHTIVLRVYQTASSYTYNGTIDGTSLYGSASLSRDDLFLDNTLSAYLFARNNNGTAGNNFVGKIYGFKVTKADVVIHDLIPCKNDGGVIGFFDIKTHTFMGAIGTLTGEVKYTTIGTASAVNLYAVGDYKDAQEIIGGTVTHRVGIKVFDGTEGWRGSDPPFSISIADKKIEKSTLLSTHFAYSSATSAQIVDGQMMCGAASTNAYFRKDDLQTLDAWKSWLAGQYAAGTPVIVLYPLATETEESVTPQPITLNEGTNVVSVTAGVSSIPLSATYRLALT